MITPNQIKMVRTILENADRNELKDLAESWLLHIGQKYPDVLTRVYKKFEKFVR